MHADVSDEQVVRRTGGQGVPRVSRRVGCLSAGDDLAEGGWLKLLLRPDAPCLRAVVAEREQGTDPAVLVDPPVQVGALRYEECLDAPTEINGAGCGAADLADPSGDARENVGAGSSPDLSQSRKSV